MVGSIVLSTDCADKPMKTFPIPSISFHLQDDSGGQSTGGQGGNGGEGL